MSLFCDPQCDVAGPHRETERERERDRKRDRKSEKEKIIDRKREIEKIKSDRVIE